MRKQASQTPGLEEWKGGHRGRRLATGRTAARSTLEPSLRTAAGAGAGKTAAFITYHGERSAAVSAPATRHA